MEETGYKIIFLGDSSVGKTSILNMYESLIFTKDNPPTVAPACKRFKLKLNNKVISLNVWDTAGQERYRTMTITYFRNTDVGVIVGDCSNPESIKNIQSWIDDLLSHSPSASIVVVLNKCDLSEDDEIAKTYNDYNVLPTSALTGYNIETLFETIGKVATESNCSVTKKNKKSDLVVLKEEKKSCC